MSSILPTLARRFLVSKSNDGFLSFIAWVSVVGVSLGVLALVVVTSVINGFENELTNVITGMNGDVILYTRDGAIREPQVLEEKIRKIAPEVNTMTRSFVMQLMVSGPQGVAGSVLEGIENETAAQVTVIPSRIRSGRMAEGEGEVTIGSALAEKIGATEGTELRLIVPFAEDSENSVPKAFKAKVVGIFKMGMHEYDSKYLLMSLPQLQKMLGQEGRVTTFKLKLTRDADSGQVAARLSDNFGYPFRAKDWAMMHKNLFYAIKLEKAVIAIILTCIVIVAAFNVVSTLMMMIHDKTQAIGILKAMGFMPGQSFRLFCFIGLGMGMVGTFFGTVIGLLLNVILAKTQLIQLPADIYYIGYLPVIVRWQEIGLIAIVAIVISFLATLYPAIQVSRKSPLDGLRYES